MINNLQASTRAGGFAGRTWLRGLTSLSVLGLLIPTLSACQAVGLATSAGPSRKAVERAAGTSTIPDLQIVDLNESIAQQVNDDELAGNFAANLGDATPIGTRVGVGDTLEVTIWEAAPAALFGGGSLDTRVGTNVQGSRPTVLPEMVVGPAGTITVPFAGQVPAAGQSLRQIEQAIVARLQGRAYLPQAIVRIARNVTANVTVLGDVKQPQRVPLTPRGERLLDAIAQAGGTSQAIDRMTIEITRGGVVQRMAARDIVRDPRHNIVLQSDDVITALYQPYSFTVLGAAGKNEEVRFEGVGLTLSQALGRFGGLQDDRADPRGVFLFRWERPDAFGEAAVGKQGGLPTIYRIDMKRPETFLVAQHFRMRDNDVLYIANSPTADLQRFVNILASSIIPVATVRSTIR